MLVTADCKWVISDLSSGALSINSISPSNPVHLIESCVAAALPRLFGVRKGQPNICCINLTVAAVYLIMSTAGAILS
jgi:hypothetical protein